MTVRVATYTRISTDEEHQPYSLEAQDERLRSYIRSQEGWELARQFTDQVSGSVLERPGLQRALAEARAQRYELLLVYRVDRLARSVRGLAEILHEFERATIIDRVIAGMERKAARGGWNGGAVPFGYSFNRETGFLEVEPDEAPLVPIIFDLYANGRLGARSIAMSLNERGLRAKSGKPWSHISVLTALRNRAYLGEVYFRDKYHRGPHSP